MMFRNSLVIIGAILILSGLGLSVTWLRQLGSTPGETVRADVTEPARKERKAVLVTTDKVIAGTLLRAADIEWKELPSDQVQQENLVRGQMSETEIFGAMTQRDFAAGEPLAVSGLLMPNDRQFLSAVLRPGRRAVSISVDAPQSASGLVLPGDFVDVILTQNLGEAAVDLWRKSVAETVLQNVRVIAVDQLLSKPVQQNAAEAALSRSNVVPKTVTLELNEREAEKLFVATQLGSLQLSVRPLQTAAGDDLATLSAPPTWASDVSPALKHLTAKPQGASSGSSLESLIRRPPPSLVN